MSTPSASPAPGQNGDATRFAPGRPPPWLQLLVVMALLLHSGCKTTGGTGGWKLSGGHPRPEDIDPNAELIHHNWWNYYLRGQSRLLSGDFAGARDDFLTCIGKRKGARRVLATDRWQARTYGTHRITDYFPNRELGIALVELRESENALQYLAKSRSQTDSGRAKYFQAKGRSQMIAGKPPAPKPSIRFPQARPLPASAAEATQALANKRPTILTNADTLPLRTVAEAGDFVAEVDINARSVWLQGAESKIDRTDPVPLLPGQIDVEVGVTDLRGQRTETEVAIIADWRAPTIHLEPIAGLGGAPIEIAGRCVDNHGIRSLTLNGKAISAEGFREVIAPGSPGLLCALDLAGNRRVVDLFAPPVVPAGRPAAGQGGQAFRPPVPGGGPALLRALDLAGKQLATDLLGALAAAGPGRSGDLVLTLAGTQPVITTERRRYYLEGEVRVPGGIASLTINGEEWLVPSEKGSTRELFFGGMLPLREGENRFTVVARDQAGKATRSEITVVRSNTGLGRTLRLHAGVLPLDLPESLVTDPKILRLSRDLERAFLETPTRVSPRFQLFVRSPSAWKAILREHRISESELSDKRARLDLGRVTATDLLFECTVSRHPRGVTLLTYCIDTGTGEVLCRDDVYIPSADPLEPVVGLADKIERRFPLLAAPVKELQRGELVVDLGRNDGLAPWSTFLIFPEPDFDNPRRVVEVPLRFRIKSLGENSSTLTLAERTSHGRFKETDYVHTR